MANSPRLGFPEVATSSTTPGEDCTELGRYIEQGANIYIVKDKDIDDPPGSPADGDAYIVHTASPSGAWTGWGKRIAFYMNTAWEDITPIEGSFAYVQDENALYLYDGAAWTLFLSGSVPTEASAAEIRTGTATGKYVSPDKMFDAADYVALTDAATVAVDMSAGLNFSLTIGGNRTLGAPSNTKNGQTGAIVITQDGTGSRTLAYHANWKFAGGTDPTLSTTAGAIDILFYQVISSTAIYANLVKAIA